MIVHSNYRDEIPTSRPSKLDAAQSRGFDPEGVMDPPTRAECAEFAADPEWVRALEVVTARAAASACCPDLMPEEHDVRCDRCRETVTRCKTSDCADCSATYCNDDECRCACPRGWRTA